MTPRLVREPEAGVDLENALAWYEEHGPAHLAGEFPVEQPSVLRSPARRRD